MAQSGGRGARGKGRRQGAAPQGGGMAGAHRRPPAGPGAGAARGGGRASGLAGAPAARPAPEAAPTPRASGGGGFRQVGAFAKGPMREAAARKGFAETRVLTDWEAIAGAELASLCRPVKVSYAGKGFGATLIVLADGARAPEVEMLGPRIVERVNAHYGYRAISRMKVVQTDRALSASRGSDRGVAAEGGDDPASCALSNEARRRAARAAEGVESPELRAALERLAANWLARRQTEGRGE